MGQTSGANHQRHGDGKDINLAFHAFGVGGKSQFDQRIVEFLQDR